MGYVAGETILDDEYNTFVNSSDSPFGYNHFAGTGAGVYGLGQTHIATVTGGTNTITASHWNSLFTAIDTIANHTNDDGSMTSRGQVSAGDTIAIKAAVAADLATLAASVAAGCPNVSSGALTTSSALTTLTSSAEGWNATATQEISATFASADTMRHFFNAGGKIRITVGATAASTSAKDQSYIDLGTALGNIDIGSQATTRSGSGESPDTGGSGLAIGFHDLTTGYQELIILTSNNDNYTSNTVQISAKLDAAVGTATVMTVKMVATDGSGDTDAQVQELKNTPRMVTTMYSITPNDTEGLASSFADPSTAEVSNSIAD